MKVEREYRDGGERREQHVGGHHLRHYRIQRRGREYRGGHDRAAPPHRARSENECREHAEQRRYCGYHARGEFIDAEEAVGNRREPVQHRRFLDIRYVVEMWHDIVAQLEHLTRDLAIARLVGLPESVGGEMKEEDQCRDDEDAEHGEDFGGRPSSGRASRIDAPANFAARRARCLLSHDPELYLRLNFREIAAERPQEAFPLLSVAGGAAAFARIE